MIYAVDNPVNEDKFVMGLNGIYAHGTLEEFLGHDVLVTDSLEEYINYSNAASIEGTPILSPDGASITTTYAVNTIGESKQIKLFLWKSHSMARGYAVCVGDEEAIAYATDKYENRSFTL